MNITKDEDKNSLLKKLTFTKTILLLVIILFGTVHLIAQENDKKGSFYVYWGYNRSHYSKTNLHFNGPDYDITFYDIVGTDRPTKFGWIYINPSTITIPQYNFRLGYFLTNRFTLSFGIDHMKYVVTRNQATTISGVISPNISSKYEGSYLNVPILLEPDLLIFEHTDGFNLVSLDVEYLQPIKLNLHKKLSLNWNIGIGGIWIATKTNVKVLNDGLDNDFHTAGYTLIGKTGPRIEFKNRLFLLGEIKGGYASLPSVLIKNAEPKLGDHNLLFLEYYFAFGVNFKFKKKRNKKSSE